MPDRIVTEVDRLRVPSEPIVDFDAKTRHLARRLVTAATGGRKVLGLSAPQIGARWTMFHFNLTPYGGPERGGLPSKGVVCNPRLLAVSDATWDREEGCLSFPRQFLMVTRPVSAGFEWFDIRGERHEVELSGMPARVWMHETDHLIGTLMTDRAAPGARLVRL